MDPAVAALDFIKAGAIIANMIESYLAAGATPSTAEGADHAKSEDCRSSSGPASLHLHSSVDNGAGALQSGEHRAPVQSSEPGDVARLDSGSDPDPPRRSRSFGSADEQSRRLQDPCERCGYGASRCDLFSGIFAPGTIEQGLASAVRTVRHHQDIERKRQFAKPPLDAIRLDLREVLAVYPRYALVRA